MIYWDTPTNGWVYGSGQMTNLIKLELIDIIWFCLKIYGLWRHPYLWVDGWVNGWAHVKSLKSNNSWPNWDNSIMDILDILLDILLKPPQPLMELFLVLEITIMTVGQFFNRTGRCPCFAWTNAPNSKHTKLYLSISEFFFCCCQGKYMYICCRETSFSE